MGAIEIVGFGAMNVDQLYLVERILTDGEAMLKGAAVFPGGSAANTIYGLARLGVRSGFLGAIGDDKEGVMLLKDFESVGVDTSQIKLKKAKTGSVLCLTDKHGRRALYVSPGANSLLSGQDINLDYVNQAKMIHLSSFVDNEQFNVQQGLLDNISPSVKVSLAPGALYAARGLKALGPLMRRSQVIFLNRSEVKQLTGEDFRTGARRCLEQGCCIVVVTLGKGVAGKGKSTGFAGYITDGDNEYMIETRQIERVEDTTGAGDAFAAGFLYGLLRDKDLSACGYLGDIAARFSISKMGARSGLPTLDELSQSYRELYQQPL